MKLKININRLWQCGVTAALLLVVILVCYPKGSEEKQNIVEPQIEVVETVDVAIDFNSSYAIGLCAGVETKLLVDKDSLDNYAAECEQKTEEENEESEYSSFAIANVDKYVNVRAQANTDSEIVGRMYDGAVAQIQETITCEDGEWFRVVSDKTEGFIKAEYFIYGEEAARVIDDYVDRYALVNADRLNIREQPDAESKRIGYALNGEKLKLSYSPEAGEEWIYVDYADDKKGYVSAEYVSVREEFIYAKTMDEVRAKEEEEKALLARAKEEETATPEITTVTASAETGVTEQAVASSALTVTTSGNLRSDIVNTGLAYVGYPYVHGGNSLETGTDCSGFTSLIYARFGIALSRTPGGQLSGNGRSISLDEALPGDIICYGKSKCTHVAIYIGNGQIVHAANPRKGVVVYNVGYDNILGVKNVID